MHITRILVPVELESEDARATAADLVATADDLVGRYGSALRVVTVIPPAGLAAGHAPCHGGGAQRELAGAQRHGAVVRTASSYLDALVRDVDAPAESAVLQGRDVVDALLSDADEHAADLLVMASRGRTGLERLVLGSVAEGVARRAALPVLLLRAETVVAG